MYKNVIALENNATTFKQTKPAGPSLNQGSLALLGIFVDGAWLLPSIGR